MEMNVLACDPYKPTADFPDGVEPEENCMAIAQ